MIKAGLFNCLSFTHSQNARSSQSRCKFIANENRDRCKRIRKNTHTDVRLRNNMVKAKIVCTKFLHFSIEISRLLTPVSEKTPLFLSQKNLHSPQSDTNRRLIARARIRHGRRRRRCAIRGHEGPRRRRQVVENIARRRHFPPWKK